MAEVKVADVGVDQSESVGDSTHHEDTEESMDTGNTANSSPSKPYCSAAGLIPMHALAPVTIKAVRPLVFPVIILSDRCGGGE